MYRDDDGLVIVDYKTDAVSKEAIASHIAIYRPQLAAYARAVEDAVGEPVVRTTLLFLSPQTAYEYTFPKRFDHEPSTGGDGAQSLSKET